MPTNAPRSRAERRRPPTAQVILPAPLALQFATPGLDAGDTVFSLPLTQFGARVANTTTGDALAAIVLTGTIDGDYQTVSASEIENGGEDAAGTLVNLTFPGELDNTQPWQLSIPAYTPLIQSRHGGTLTGTFDNGQAVTVTDGGFVRLSNASDGPLFPPLFFVTQVALGPGDNADFSTESTANSPFTFDGVPNIVGSGVGAATAISDQGNGIFRCDFGSTPGAGEQFTLPSWDPAIRSAAGKYLAPGLVSLPS